MPKHNQVFFYLSDPVVPLVNNDSNEKIIKLFDYFFGFLKAKQGDLLEKVKFFTENDLTLMKAIYLQLIEEKKLAKSENKDITIEDLSTITGFEKFNCFLIGLLNLFAPKKTEEEKEYIRYKYDCFSDEFLSKKLEINKNKIDFLSQLETQGKLDNLSSDLISNIEEYLANSLKALEEIIPFDADTLFSKFEYISQLDVSLFKPFLAYSYLRNELSSLRKIASESLFVVIMNICYRASYQGNINKADLGLVSKSIFICDKILNAWLLVLNFQCKKINRFNYIGLSNERYEFAISNYLQFIHDSTFLKECISVNQIYSEKTKTEENIEVIFQEIERKEIIIPDETLDELTEKLNRISKEYEKFEEEMNNLIKLEFSEKPKESDQRIPDNKEENISIQEEPTLITPLVQHSVVCQSDKKEGENNPEMSPNIQRNVPQGPAL